MPKAKRKTTPKARKHKPDFAQTAFSIFQKAPSVSHKMSSHRHTRSGRGK
jgi:hypothetical protein